MAVEQVADRFYKVHSESGNTYEIDLQPARVLVQTASSAASSTSVSILSE
jgi:hypothetical protein